MNLTILKKSRRVPIPGDVFALLPPDGEYLYGRVIANDARPIVGFQALLIYIYRARSKVKEEIPTLRRTELLVAPIMTNKLPWSHGYFENISHRPLTCEDRLPRHCFALPWPTRRFFDEMGNEIHDPEEPIGVWGLRSFRTIDDEVSKALGIPVAPE